jgi:hypothetical protein
VTKAPIHTSEDLKDKRDKGLQRTEQRRKMMAEAHLDQQRRRYRTDH